MYQLISDRIRKVADLIDIEKKTPTAEPETLENLPSAPKIKPKRRINREQKVMAPRTEQGKQDRKDYQSEYRANGDDIGNRYVKKPNIE